MRGDMPPSSADGGWRTGFPVEDVTSAFEDSWSPDTNPRPPDALSGAQRSSRHTAWGAGLAYDDTGYLFVCRPQGKVTVVPVDIVPPNSSHI